jgi:hypothetical protein
MPSQPPDRAALWCSTADLFRGLSRFSASAKCCYCNDLNFGKPSSAPCCYQVASVWGFWKSALGPGGFSGPAGRSRPALTRLHRRDRSGPVVIPDSLNQSSSICKHVAIFWLFNFRKTFQI